VAELTGVPHGERDRSVGLTSRNGYRDRRSDTRVVTIGLSIPKIRNANYSNEQGDESTTPLRIKASAASTAKVMGTPASDRLPINRQRRARLIALRWLCGVRRWRYRCSGATTGLTVR
jgi:hypothetical protein